MKQHVKLTMADPRARVVENEHTLWIASGLDEPGIASLRHRGGSGSGIEEELCRRYGDATIIKVSLSRGHVGSISAWKGLTAGYDVFYRIGPDRSVVVSDHFRNILSAVPVAERVPTHDVLCDHFLFRTVPGQNTFCPTVKRLDRGETILIDPDSGTSRIERFDWVEVLAEPGRIGDYLDRLDGALESALGVYRSEPDVAALFSGGVDSTLIQTYLGSDVPAIFYELPRYEREFEANYAGRSADLLGIELEKRVIDVDGYLGLLERAIDAAAIPPPHLQLVLYQALFASGRSRLVLGEQADALFGIELRRARLASPFRSAAGRATLKVAESVAFSRAHRLRKIREAATRLAEQPYSLDGYGAQFGTYTHRPLLEAVFGRQQVRARLQARLDVARSMLRSAAPVNRFHHHVELAQMIDYLCEDIMMCFRHLAHAFGRSMTTPFTARPVLDAALSIPAEERYLSGLEGKHLLKRLLKRRLPSYPVNQRKGYTHLPFTGMYRHGALSQVWQRYPVPDLFEGKDRETLVETSTQMTWNAITLAIWQDRVQNNPNLQPLAGSRAYAWGDARSAAAQSDV